MTTITGNLLGGTTSGKNWPVVGGREIYKLDSISGLNRSPIDTLEAFILQGALYKPDPPFDDDELVRRHLVDGRYALIDVERMPERFRGEAGKLGSGEAGKAEPVGAVEDPAPKVRYQFLDGLVLDEEQTPFSRRRFAQRFWGEVPGRSGLALIERDFIRQADGRWLVRDFELDHRDKPLDQAEIGADELRVFAFGDGVLKPAQKGFRRLEEIFVSLRKLQTGVNSKTIVTGYLGNIGQAKQALNDPESDTINFPLASGVNRVASTAAVDQLVRELEALLPRYLQSVHIVDTSHLDRTATVSRRLLMLPMLNFVEKARRELQLVFSEFGVTAGFERIRVDGIEERIRQYELLKLMRDDSVITPVEFQTESKSLVNMRGGTSD